MPQPQPTSQDFLHEADLELRYIRNHMGAYLSLMKTVAKAMENGCDLRLSRMMKEADAAIDDCLKNGVEKVLQDDPDRLSYLIGWPERAAQGLQDTKNEPFKKLKVVERTLLRQFIDEWRKSVQPKLAGYINSIGRDRIAADALTRQVNKHFGPALSDFIGNIAVKPVGQSATNNMVSLLRILAQVNADSAKLNSVITTLEQYGNSKLNSADFSQQAGELRDKAKEFAQWFNASAGKVTMNVIDHSRMHLFEISQRYGLGNYGSKAQHFANFHEGYLDLVELPYSIAGRVAQPAKGLS